MKLSDKKTANICKIWQLNITRLMLFSQNQFTPRPKNYRWRHRHRHHKVNPAYSPSPDAPLIVFSIKKRWFACFGHNIMPWDLARTISIFTRHIMWQIHMFAFQPRAFSILALTLTQHIHQSQERFLIHYHEKSMYTIKSKHFYIFCRCIIIINLCFLQTAF